jgi:tRNA threonylcarbamoyladenosine biosynthesis protein TsaB
MSLFLLLDTALPKGIVCLAEETGIIDVCYNEEQTKHATWLHVAIERLLEKNKVPIKAIDVVSVTNGPGSYTGLRIGLSAAKGLCYALKKPLITINTLEIIATANYDENAELIIPMIDARREEVYTSSYDHQLNCIKPTHGLILQPKSFEEGLKTQRHIFCGTAAIKLAGKIEHKNAFFRLKNYTEMEFLTLTKNKFTAKFFSDLAYTVPEYGKDFMQQSL